MRISDWSSDVCSSDLGPVEHGREPAPAEAGGDIQWATDGQLLFGAIEVDEARVDGITAAAEHASARMPAFAGPRDPPPLLRAWISPDETNLDDRDAARHPELCVGRPRRPRTLHHHSAHAAPVYVRGGHRAGRPTYF